MIFLTIINTKYPWCHNLFNQPPRAWKFDGFFFYASKQSVHPSFMGSVSPWESGGESAWASLGDPAGFRCPTPPPVLSSPGPGSDFCQPVPAVLRCPWKGAALRSVGNFPGHICAEIFIRVGSHRWTLTVCMDIPSMKGKAGARSYWSFIIGAYALGPRAKGLFIQ